MASAGYSAGLEAALQCLADRQRLFEFGAVQDRQNAVEAHTVYRVHGTNAPETIGHAVSSGCFRLVNSEIEDLYTRVPVGTKIVVLTEDGSYQERAKD